MKKLTRCIPLITLFFLLKSFAAHAGCEHDNDCKGTRICEDGVCVYPPEESAPTPPPAAESPPAVDVPEGSPSVDDTATESPAEDPPDGELTDENGTSEPAPPPESAPTSPAADASVPEGATAESTSSPETDTSATSDAPPTEASPVTATADPDPATATPPPKTQPAPTEPVPATSPVAPTSATAPDVPEPPAATESPTDEDTAGSQRPPSHFQHGFGEVDSVIGFATRGKMFLYADGESDDTAMSGGAIPGIRIAAYASGRRSQHGGYLNLRWTNLEVEDLTDSVRFLGIGYSVKKMNTQSPRRVHPGFAFDIGLVRMKNNDMADSTIEFENDTFTGLEMYPRFELDIVAVHAGGFKLIVPISIGVYVVPFCVMKLMDDPVTVVSMFSIVQPAMTIGLAFGG